MKIPASKLKELKEQGIDLYDENGKPLNALMIKQFEIRAGKANRPEPPKEDPIKKVLEDLARKLHETSLQQNVNTQSLVNALISGLNVLKPIPHPKPIDPKIDKDIEAKKVGGTWHIKVRQA